MKASNDRNNYATYERGIDASYVIVSQSFIIDEPSDCY